MGSRRVPVVFSWLSALSRSAKAHVQLDLSRHVTDLLAAQTAEAFGWPCDEATHLGDQFPKFRGQAAAECGGQLVGLVVMEFTGAIRGELDIPTLQLRAALQSMGCGAVAAGFRVLASIELEPGAWAI